MKQIYTNLSDISIGIMSGGIGTAKTVDFDISGIPAGATVQALRLSCDVSRPSVSGTAKIGSEDVAYGATAVVELDVGTRSIRFSWTIGQAQSKNVSISFRNIVVTADVSEGITPVSAPTSATLSASSCEVGNTVGLSWTGAKPGTGNTIAGYSVEYRESTDGSEWSGWVSLALPAADVTGIQVNAANTAGIYRQFRVKARGAAGSEYDSAWCQCQQTLKTIAPDRPYEQQPLETMPAYRAVFIWRRIG